MGNVREYIASGGFAQYLYCQIGETLVSGNGVSGKIITEYDDGTNFHSSLPMFSNTSEVYLKWQTTRILLSRPGFILTDEFLWILIGTIRIEIFKEGLFMFMNGV